MGMKYMCIYCEKVYKSKKWAEKHTLCKEELEFLEEVERNRITVHGL